MPKDTDSRNVARFADYEVHFRAGELYKAGRKIKLQIQPFQILAILLENPGQVVTRAELQKRLWPADTFVDFDHSLNTAIKKLRQALCDDKKQPRFVETLPKRGYRFIGAVEDAKPAGPSGSAGTAKFSEATARAGADPTAKASGGSSWMGRVAKVSTHDKASFTLVAADAEAAAEREKLDAVNDDVGLSLLIASQKLLMLTNGTQVRVLEVHDAGSRCQVRILDGEHYGKTALVPVKLLKELA